MKRIPKMIQLTVVVSLLASVSLPAFAAEVSSEVTQVSQEQKVQDQKTVTSDEESVAPVTETTASFSEETTQAAIETETTTASLVEKDSQLTETSDSQEETSEEGQVKRETKGDFKAPIITEDNQHALGSSLKNARQGLPRLNWNSNVLPRADFIDISSHQGTMTVAHFNNLKKYGVSGVIVKLTEGTSYRNPFAASQIANAKSAGMKVSVYHYSWFSTTQSAKAEADYFLKFARELGLGSDVVMINDIEEPQVKKFDQTTNSVAFAKQLIGKGIKSVLHYSSLSWFSDGTLNQSKLGGSQSVWIAQYPYEPSKNNLLHTDKSAWQWASDLKFPGDSRQFDVNIDYKGMLSNPPFKGQKVDYKLFLRGATTSIYTLPSTTSPLVSKVANTKHKIARVTEKTTQNNVEWLKIEYQNKTGWVPLKQTANYINHKKYQKLSMVLGSGKPIYNKAYLPWAKKIGNTTALKNSVADIFEVATTAYGEWYKVNYTIGGVKKSGWVESKEFVDVVKQKKLKKKVFIRDNKSAIYSRAYIPGKTKRLDTTNKLKNQVVEVLSEATTAYGHWYEIRYTRDGKKKTGWLRSPEVLDYINKKNINTVKKVAKNAAIYAKPYVPGVKRIGTTAANIGQKARMTQRATTAYGEWIYVTIGTNKNNEKKGWIRLEEVK